MLGHLLVAGPGADEPGLADSVVPHEYALDQLGAGLLLVHPPPGHGIDHKISPIIAVILSGY